MNSLQDVVYNWLTIMLVAEKRPDDIAAQDTTTFFRNMLTNDHHVDDIQVERKEDMYFVSCQQQNNTRSFRFPLELIDCIHEQIEQEPHKFKNYK
ncbi:hypothetical protein HNQ94_003472 [Salirhabdus euzebyi]|uniref:Uncharacterized protein n=1 Tax=Salirhabdus euzebyi TaxID=394506 RepID=A0A841Q983_9BACI|nr:hypothetical protein [Salirhabdus euzebyi]MBB6454978.1 hypothetical protein [Salirhabdus euzebyi]